MPQRRPVQMPFIPGYGFLSENPAFARKVKEAGITFIGPSAEAMEMMGSKLNAKATAEKHNIPLVPGTAKAIEDMAEARNVADKIGFPVLIKASAGGGGKGMRMVEERSQFEEQMKRAQSEAHVSLRRRIRCLLKNMLLLRGI